NTRRSSGGGWSDFPTGIALTPPRSAAAPGWAYSLPTVAPPPGGEARHARLARQRRHPSPAVLPPSPRGRTRATARTRPATPATLSARRRRSRPALPAQEFLRRADHWRFVPRPPAHRLNARPQG